MSLPLCGLFQKPVETVLIKKGELINYEEVVGYVIRNEEIIDTSSYDGVVKSEVDDATRVSKGSTVVTYVSRAEEQIMQKISELDEKIDKAIESQQTILNSDVRTLENEIETYIYANIKGNTDLTTTREYKKYLNDRIEKKAKIVGELSPAGSELKTLIEQRTVYETELNNSEKTLKSPTAGLISYRVDNLENILTYNAIPSLTIKDLTSLKTTLDQTISVNHNKIKVVDNFGCYIAVPMYSDAAHNVKLNDTVYLRFKNTGDTQIPATVEYISTEEEGVLLVFKIRANVEELTKYRKISLDVVWWSSTGLKINKEVIFYSTVPVNEVNISGDVSEISGDEVVIGEQLTNENISSGDGDSNIPTIQIPSVAIKKAYNTDEVFVKILRETEDFVIIDNYKDAELTEMGVSEDLITNRTTLKMYDEVVINY